ncbi:hypothetical protein HOLleu_03141 [Holothuria leucospilota]|uniref:Uncharacterized protein n=1 Tax=Holothuria leucospilota TaxID=206669 RepID=A0A9Q1HHG2_HOLLE|nr:hypothetical protein HOLleu_03141 [Holothuria leucospilota]
MEELNLDGKVARKQEVEEMLQRIGETSWSDQEGGAPLLRTQLLSYSRKKGDTVAQLGVSIQRLADAAYPTVDSVASQILALDHFKKALNDKEMENFLFLGRPKDLKEAVGLVARVRGQSYCPAAETGVCSERSERCRVNNRVKRDFRGLDGNEESTGTAEWTVN